MLAVKGLDDLRELSGSTWKLEYDEEMDALQMQRMAGRSALISIDQAPSV